MGKKKKKSMVYVSDIWLKDTYCISKSKWRYKACVDYVDNSSSEFHIQDELISLG